MSLLSFISIIFVCVPISGVFVDLVDILEPLGVQLPSQLLTSPYLALQREQRKRKLDAPVSSRKRKTTKDLYNR